MNNTLNDFIKNINSEHHATAAGSAMHGVMHNIRVLADGTLVGDSAIISRIQSRPDIARFFAVKSRPEVPVAGVVNGHFISRRIDRLYIDDTTKTVLILDYKTDINHSVLYDKYVAQLREYASLMRQIYPDYKIEKYILWLHDWSLEQIK